MSARLLGSLALLLIMGVVAAARDQVFALSLLGGFLLLATRFFLLPRLHGGAVPPRLRRSLNVMVAASLWLALLVQFLSGILTGDLLSPLAVAVGVWFLFDQPSGLLIDTFYVGLVTLLAIVCLIVGAASALAMPAMGFGGLLLIAAFGALDRQRLADLAARRDLAVHIPSDWRLLPVLVAVGVLLGVISPLDLPEVGRSSGRDGADQSSYGFGRSMELGSMARHFPQDAEMLHVRVSLGQRELTDSDGVLGGRAFLFRGQILDVFDGRRFRLPSTRARRPADPVIPSRQRHLFLDVSQTVQHLRADTATLYAMAPVVFSMDGGRVSPGPRGGLVKEHLSLEDPTYSVRSRVFDPARRRSLRRRAVLRGRRMRPYLQLPRAWEPRRRVAGLTRDIIRDARDDASRVMAIERYLRDDGGFRYSLMAAEQDLGRFLFQGREGYCEHFAAAMAVMLRTAGIPSRVARGFRGGVYSERWKAYRLLGQDAHAWVEVPFDELGWISFDPTPPATMRDIASAESGPREVGADPVPPPVPVTEQAATLESDDLMIVPLLLVAALLAGAVLWLWRANRGQAACTVTGGDAGSRSLVRRLLGVLKRAGARPRAPATLLELLGEARLLREDHASDLRAVIQRIYGARFGARRLDGDSRRDLFATLARIENELPRQAAPGHAG